MRTLTLGTRGSKLALTQSQLVADALSVATGHDVKLVTIATSGDKSSAPLSSIGGTGVFVTALRDAVLAGDVDFAVHSLKDLPTAPADGLVVAAIPQRADARDALCARDGLALAELPSGSKIGTGSPRRAAQINALGLGFEIVPIRGNVDTRLAKVTDGELDAVVLAWAGLDRLGRLDAVTEALDPMQVLPAPGQGALAVECRAEDDDLRAALATLDDAGARAAVTAERKLLAVLEAGCTAPVGAFAEVSEVEPNGGSVSGEFAMDVPPRSELYLRAVVSSEDGTEHIRKSATGPVERAIDLGREVAEEMLADGAGAIVGAQRGTPKEERVP